MGLFTQEFLTERREEFMGLISKFEYEINGGEKWLTATERSRQIVGNYIRFTLLFPNVLQSDYSITAIRIIDVNNKEIARRDLSVDVNSIQTVLFVLSISYQEV
jgi:hypothetical protein